MDGSNGLPLHARLMFLAQAYSDTDGWARFERGEVRSLLKVQSAQVMSNAIKRAVTDGFLSRGSTSTALRLPVGDITRGKASTMPHAR